MEPWGKFTLSQTLPEKGVGNKFMEMRFLHFTLLSSGLL